MIVVGLTWSFGRGGRRRTYAAKVRRAPSTQLPTKLDYAETVSFDWVFDDWKWQLDHHLLRDGTPGEAKSPRLSVYTSRWASPEKSRWIGEPWNG